MRMHADLCGFLKTGMRLYKPERYLWKPLWPKDISAGDIFGPESVSVKIYYGWNTCWATSPNPPGKISFRDVFKERYLFLQKRTPRIQHSFISHKKKWNKKNLPRSNPLHVKTNTNATRGPGCRHQRATVRGCRHQRATVRGCRHHRARVRG